MGQASARLPGRADVCLSSACALASVVILLSL